MKLTKKSKISLIILAVLLITVISVIFIKPLVVSYLEEIEIQKNEIATKEKLKTAKKWDSKSLNSIGIGKNEFSTKWEKGEMLYILKLSKNDKPNNFKFSKLQIEFFDKDGFSAFKFDIYRNEFAKKLNELGEIDNISINSKIKVSTATYMEFTSYQISWYNE